MALVRQSSSSGTSASSNNPGRLLEEAIAGFENALSEDQLIELRQTKAVPDADAVMTFTAHLDAANRSRRGRSIASRLHTVLQCVRDFTAIVDTLVSSNPDVAAVVWGSVKLTMLLVARYTSYFEDISGLFMRVSAQCPRFEEYQALFPTSLRLQRAICDFHASIIRCCKHVVEAVQRPWQIQVLNVFRQSFDQEFEPDKIDMQNCGKDVKDEIVLAKAESDRAHQELQHIETEAVKKGILGLLLHSKSHAKTVKEMRLEKYQVDSRKRMQRLLQSLSSHDFRQPYKEACQKRHYSTAEWIFSTPEYHQWINQSDTPLLWCAGKIGSGKTVLTASTIDHVVREKKACDRVAFFFLRYDDSTTRKAETVVRSIIRQALDPLTISNAMETKLRSMDMDAASLKDWIALLRHAISPHDPFFIFLDALDECESVERYELLKQLASLVSYVPRLKIFISGRESLSNELRANFPKLQRVSMSSTEAASDIGLYVEDTLQQRLQDGAFVVGDESLLNEIKTTLVEHADGMFIWVTYLLNEILGQYCDNGIRDALAHLPKSLEETFNRALGRIATHGRTAIVLKVFRWVATAQRHMTLEELGDVVSVKIGQKSSDPGGQWTNTNAIASWCENLVQVDDEKHTVQFAHRTVYEFIIGKSTIPEDASFHIQLEEADHHAGEICMTYLHFSDFETTLAQPRKRSLPVQPGAIVGATFGHDGVRAKVLRQMSKLLSDGDEPHICYGLETASSFARSNSEEAIDMLRQAHPFLGYASQHWISHTSKFMPGISSTWQLWYRVVAEGHDLAQCPWGKHCFSSPWLAKLRWAFHTRHYALLRAIDSSCGLLTTDLKKFISQAAAEGDMELFDALLDGEQSVDIIGRALPAASNGHLEIVLRILDRKVNVETASRTDGITALQVACRGGHLAIVERLLAANANVNATSNIGYTPLMAASEGGHLPVVRRLLVAGAAVGVAARDKFQTALQAACHGGHFEVARKLIAASSDVNFAAYPDKGRTALQAACENGHIEIVKMLLLKNANIDAGPASEKGRTALQAACESGHINVVQLLLAANAHVHAAACLTNGRTALQAASGAGCLEIVEILLAAAADVNAVPSDVDGRTALQAACENGHMQVVRKLLAVGADVNVDITAGGLTALQAAASGGHLEIVELLLGEKAHVNDAPDFDKNQTALRSAAAGGHLEVVERLLTAKAKVNVTTIRTTGRTALQAAARNGHLDVVERLLAANAHVNTTTHFGNDRTALQAAAGHGHLDVVNRLLVAKADVHAAASYGGRTALQAACEGGYLEIVDRLLAAGADVNTGAAEQMGRTALQAACELGHVELVDRLLAANAEVDAMAGFVGGRTALQAAAEKGHLPVVERLLAANANVNAAAARREGRTALKLACERGHIEIAERLRSAGAVY